MRTSTRYRRATTSSSFLHSTEDEAENRYGHAAVPLTSSIANVSSCDHVRTLFAFERDRAELRVHACAFLASHRSELRLAPPSCRAQLHISLLSNIRSFRHSATPCQIPNDSTATTPNHPITTPTSPKRPDAPRLPSA